eukprot:CAMPEP_0119222070 /NCGR_PEP_ID=MMETSP1327-20130426/29838_1 /TAXON_ID=38833 /ORGANISM="Micromonas pusilla, Strain RCC2306" /LENGTH=113 /DNA_ID=CAMNT_0007220265 /DNA_START=459 /DNA_END=797 /DNA_ORIENTATION=-
MPSTFSLSPPASLPEIDDPPSKLPARELRPDRKDDIPGIAKPANWDMRFKDMYGVEVVLRAEVAGAGHGESPGDVPLVGALLVRKEGVIPPSPFFTLPNPSPPRSSSSSSSSL